MPARLRTREASFALAADRAAPERRDGAGGFEEPSMLSITSIGSFASKIFGSSNDRLVKGYRPRVAAINALEAEVARLSDARAACPHRPVPQAARGRRRSGRSAGAGLCHRARGGQAHARPAPFRRAAHRRHGAAPGQDLRDEDRRGQDAGRHAARLSQRPGRTRRACRHRQRLPRQARRRVDGRHLQVPGPYRRLHRARARRRPARAAVRLRRHLRHQQRVRLRLSARQHEDARARHGAARRIISRSSTRWTRS